MKSKPIHPVILLSLLLASGEATLLGAGGPPHPAVVKEYVQTVTTYPYTDPDPIPRMSKFYPYFRFDGFTDQPIEKSWKVVELSNDYVRVLILPEIGGKVWTAIEKSTGKPFLYYNHVIKFRDIAMRGPWTSGGLEANYGIVGHAPSCASPVDYLVRTNPDGSASCIIGVLDLITRSTWSLEINLPADQADFTTRSIWHNGSGAEEPYYSWMNAGIKADGNLQFVYPGTRYVRHDGRTEAWPINPANGHDISWYEQNDFGPYKSYHVFGRLADFSGGYWHDDDFGMARVANYEDKPGRKIFIWGLSRQGMVWEKLLTDTDGPYVEVQSGRLFNQTVEASSVTPFKHKEFLPYATDTWIEHWMPVKGIGGFVSASAWGAMNVTPKKGELVIGISPVRPLRDNLEVFDGDRLLFTQMVDLQPMRPVEVRVPIAEPVGKLRVRVGGDKLQYSGTGDELSRPAEAPAHFDWTTAYGWYLKGKESERERAYAPAAEAFQASLKIDPGFVPALVESAALAVRQGDYATALDFARQALAIDTYDPEANYQFGLASAASGHEADAQDGFSIAALSPGWRSAACVELAKVFFRQKRYERALASTEESLDDSRLNLDAYALQACIHRLQGDGATADEACKTLLKLDPLNALARFERTLQGKASRQEFVGAIRDELPQETYLELAAWYRSIGLNADAARVLGLAPQNAEVMYWEAYLNRDAQLLAQAEAASPAFVFPFRTESIPVFEWAAKRSQAWQAKYYLALIHWSQGKLSIARELLKACGDQPNFGPFYAARAELCEESAIPDLQRAAETDPGQWRYGLMLAQLRFDRGDIPGALGMAADYSRRFPANGTLALLHTKTLLASGHYAEAADLLDTLNLLPSEAKTPGHAFYREAHLMLAVEALGSGAWPKALEHIKRAAQWPEHLGAGQPYPEDEDTRLDDWLTYQCELQGNDSAKARQTLDRILAVKPDPTQKSVGEAVRILALSRPGSAAESAALLKSWAKEDPANGEYHVLLEWIGRNTKGN